MAQILVRGLQDDVVGRLKDRAASDGRSLESEARMILESAIGFTVDEARRVVKEWQVRLAGRRLDDSRAPLNEDLQ
jgi:plasmid stability protein